MTGAGGPARAGRAWQGHEHYAHKVLSALIRDPGRIAVTGPGLDLPAGALARSVLAVAAQLRRSGVTHGSTVAILTEPNHPHMLTIRYAVHLTGAAAVYIRSTNARSDERMLPASDQEQMLAEVRAGLLVTDEANLARGRDLCRGLPCEAVAADLDVPAVAPAQAELGGALRALPAPGYEPESLLVITYTNGSTGRPKAVCHSYRTWNNMAAGFEAVVRGAAPPRFLAVTPVAQTVGVMLDGTLAAGGSVVLLRRFGAAEVLHAFTDLGVTDCYLAVPHLYALTEDAAVAAADLSGLRSVIYSGSPAAPRRIAQSARIFGRALLQSYGSTESGPISYLGSWEHLDAELLSTVGRPYPGVRVRVCDPGSRREQPAGECGEIWIRSGSIMSGYLDDPELNAEVLRDGWLRTGDLGYLDDRGYLRLVDRIGQVIKNGGLKIYPTTIEKALMDHPDVREAAVIGVRHRHDYEEAYAAVAIRPGAACTLADLREHVSGLLSPEQAPAVMSRWAALPADESGKVDRPLLRTLVEAGDGWRHGQLAEG